MNITILGANGRVGRQVVAVALSRGHIVKAFVHNQPNLSEHDKLEFIIGDVYDSSSIESALDGSQAVISALGSWGTPKKDVLSAAMANLLPLMKKHGISKIVSLTGADSEVNGDNNKTIHRLTRHLLKLIAPKILSDSERHIALLEKSNLTWAVLRSPVMTEAGDPKNFALTSKRPLPWQSVNRMSVAEALVDLVESDSQNCKAPFIIQT